MNVPAIAVAVSLTLAIAAQAPSAPADLSGQVLYSGLAVPGASLTVKNGDRVATTTSDGEGAFRFDGLGAGAWTLRVEMRGFDVAVRELSLPLAQSPLTITLTMRRYEDIVRRETPPQPDPAPIEPTADVDVDVINGSVINGAATPFAQPRTFGNNRARPGATFTGLVNAVFADSAWNARPFSFGAASLPPPSTADAQFGFTIGGPLKVPRLVRHGPQMLLSLQHGVTNSTASGSAVMPLPAERRGDFSGSETAVRDPRTGQPFPGGVIPADRITAQAQSLLALYPQANVTSAAHGNYQSTLPTRTTQDAVQIGINAQRRRTTIGGSFAFQHAHGDSIGIFGFDDATRLSTLTAAGNWQRRISTQKSARLRYQITRSTSTLLPFFANRTNVSADAGIAGNSQAPADWGPPALSFPDVASLRDQNYQDTTIVSQSAGGDYLFKRGRHDVTVGGDGKHASVEAALQADARGTLAFTGAASGIPFADFLLGIPSTSTIGFGNAPASLHGNAFDAYATDDWRLSGLTLNLGVRWEYETPFSDASGRVRGAVRADASGIEPRLGASWRPFLASSLVIRASYGLYRNLGLYQPLAILLSEQPPFSRTFSVQNTRETPLSLAAPFPETVPSARTFAVTPDFLPGSVQNWQVTVQRDLPASLTAIVAYLGTKGAHLTQASLPNSYPSGGVDPCASCPSGYVLVTSGGHSLRNAAQFTLRRRLHSGLTASAQYTLSKATDDAATFSNTTLAPGTLTVAQDWLDLSAERGPSSFDQRHLLTAQVQYTTGVGGGGGTLLDGFWASLFKDWTVASQLSTGSGLPFTPVSFVAIAGTGSVGMRPRLTGIPPLPAAAGAYANPAAYATPVPGTWGDAGRNSIRGPAQFALDASIARVFRPRGKTSLEWRVAATNVLNHVTFAVIDTTIGSSQFGRPTFANPMRRVHMTLRYRF